MVQSRIFCVYPALTGSKTPTSRFRETRKIDGGSTAHKSPIGSGQQDVGHSGVAIGHGAFNLSSSVSVKDEENPPLMEASLYLCLWRFYCAFKRNEWTFG
ncbi:hypothetical protein [Rummeliibacillus suwonensis]|uniref:hypothetical protein n=1 Tax=Rummeliibacillus suwonensis TaxID=1306154 RepID=UPI00289C6462|nr:hypothetical protein [Rummeliibacillus suwonensis]